MWIKRKPSAILKAMTTDYGDWCSAVWRAESPSIVPAKLGDSAKIYSFTRQDNPL